MEYYYYDAFGKVSITDAYDNPLSSSSVDNPYFFTGRRLDTETGLYYYRNRYYNPDTGRFLTVDPLGYSEGMNLYTYCRNNPVNWVDPMGLWRATTKGHERKAGNLKSTVSNQGDIASGLKEQIDIEIDTHTNARDFNNALKWMRYALSYAGYETLPDAPPMVNDIFEDSITEIQEIEIEDRNKKITELERLKIDIEKEFESGGNK